MKLSEFGTLTFLALCGIAISGCSGSSSTSSSDIESAMTLMPGSDELTQEEIAGTDTNSTDTTNVIDTTDTTNVPDNAVCTPSQRAATDTPPFLGNLYRTETANDERFHQFWNQVTPENAGKWNAVETQRDSMAWTALDEAFNFSSDFNYTFTLHTLISGNGEPSWMRLLSNDEQLEEIIEWMDELAARYPSIENIDVVSNPFTAPPSFIDALGGAGDSGWDWIIRAFELADARFPNSTLIFNSANVQPDNESTASFIAIANALNERGLIDRIGVEGHFLEEVEPAGLKTKLDQLAATGIPLHVASLDLDFADDEQQLTKIRSIFPVLYDHESMQGITFWGYRENQLWRQNAFLISQDEVDRPALTWLECFVGG